MDYLPFQKRKSISRQSGGFLLCSGYHFWDLVQQLAHERQLWNHRPVDSK